MSGDSPRSLASGSAFSTFVVIRQAAVAHLVRLFVQEELAFGFHPKHRLCDSEMEGNRRAWTSLPTWRSSAGNNQCVGVSHWRVAEPRSRNFFQADDFAIRRNVIRGNNDTGATAHLRASVGPRPS